MEGRSGDGAALFHGPKWKNLSTNLTNLTNGFHRRLAWTGERLRAVEPLVFTTKDTKHTKGARCAPANLARPQ